MTHLVDTYGYWIVGLLVGLENLVLPLPGEASLIVAATYAGQSHHLSPYWLVVVAVVSAIIGANLGYSLGAKGGRKFVERYGHYIHVGETEMKIGRYLFDRYGSKVVLIGRFIPILRSFVALLAGISAMDRKRFAAANAAGAIVWSIVITAVGDRLGHVSRKASTGSHVGTLVVVLVLVVVVVAVVHRQWGKLRDLAEAAYPGPLPA